MRKKFHPGYFEWIILLIVITACTQQARATPMAPFTRLPDVTKTITSAIQPIIPTVTKSPSPTPGPYSLVTPLSQVLPPGQYLTYMDGCNSGNSHNLCRFYAVSIDGSVDQLLVKDLRIGEFIYNRARLGATIDYYESDLERFRIQLFDLEHEQVVEIPSPAGKDCKTEDWSPDGTQLLVRCQSLDEYYDLELGLISIQSGEYTLLLHDPNEKNESGGYDSPRLSPNGKWLSFYRLWSKGPDIVEGLYVTDMSCLSEPSTCQAKTHRFPVKQLVGKNNTRVMAWTPENNLSMSIDDRIEIYDVKSEQRIRVLQADPAGGTILEMAWSPDGKWLVVNQWDKSGSLLIPFDVGQSLHVDIRVERPFWITVP